MITPAWCICNFEIQDGRHRQQLNEIFGYNFWTVMHRTTIFVSRIGFLWTRIAFLVLNTMPLFPLACDATTLVRRTKKLTDTQQDRRDGLVEHLRRYYFACVAYQLRIDDAHATHMAYECRCHCVWFRVWELYHCIFTAQVAFAQRTSHVCAAVNAIRWRSVAYKWPCNWIHMYLNVQFHLSNLIPYVYHRNDIVLITGRIIC